MPVAASAAPAADAQQSSFSKAGAFNGTVPDGVCAVSATVAGGAGGSAASQSSGVQNSNGQAAEISATFSVLPGQEFKLGVGGGGKQNGVGQHAYNGGGAGNGVEHVGASGGGYSALYLDGELAVLAGGGGGSGGGHPDAKNPWGMGGDAGLPTEPGETAPGEDGTRGKDGKDQFNGRDYTSNTVTGGRGGGVAAGGAGGTNSGDSGRNGSAGSEMQGGTGGKDDNADGSGGGGGGLYGGGGGASTEGVFASVPGVTGGGGGGGSSFVAGAARDVSSQGVGSLQKAGNADDGSVTLDWVMCDYDLSITKTAVDEDDFEDATLMGSTITWTVAVTNEGPAAMTKGDTVALTDSLPGAGSTAITSISTKGGSSDLFESGKVTCGVEAGDAMPATLTCSRPYALSGESADGVRGLNVGETLTVTYTQVVTDRFGEKLSNTASVTDRTEGDTNDSATITTKVTANPPTARNDSDDKNKLGSSVTVDVVDNDTAGTGKLVASSVKLVNPDTKKPIDGSYAVPGQGTWSVSDKGAVTFTPLKSFFGDPTPIGYQISDENGLSALATVTVSYVPEAADDEDLDNTIGDAVPVNVMGNDKGAFDASTLRILDGSTPVTKLVVRGEGTWAVNAGVITFTPEDGFDGDPTPISYKLADQKGAQVTAKVTVTYLAVAADDSKLDNVIGTVVVVPVLGNDRGTIDPASVRIDSGGERVTELTVDGEGTWTVDEKTGDITFSPEDGFEGDPTPIAYEATDAKDAVVTAKVSVTYQPAALKDEDLGNTLGEIVDVSVGDNDKGDFDLSTVRILADGSNPVETLAVVGEGTWTVEDGGVIRFTPEDGFLGDPTPISYSVAGQRGVVVTATLTVEYLPQAKADAHTGNTIGDSVTVDVLANDADTGIFDATSVRITDGTTAVTELVVEGEGTWTVDTKTGRITFAPEDGFLVDPTPITYQVTDTTGDTVSAPVTVEYLPQAADDEDLGNTIGEAVDVTVLGNDTGHFEAASVRILDGTTPVSELIVSGEGTWTIEDGGVIRFTPEAGFLGDPTTIGYQVADVTGDVVSAQVTVAYVPEAVADASHGNVIGQPVTVDVVNSDTGDLDPASVRIIDPTNNARVLSLTVAGQGAWNVDPATGEITFTPESGFEGNPTPIVYEVTDRTGDTVSASVIVSYLPEAADDVNSGNTEGEAVTVNVLGNDTGVFDPTSVMLIDPDTKELVKSLTVDGEGVWGVNPETGAITFTPEAGFIGDPTPVSYQVTDLSGNVTTADVTIQYVHPEAPAAAALPVTGADVLAPLTIGVVVLLLGGAALLIARRRNTEN